MDKQFFLHCISLLVFSIKNFFGTFKSDFAIMGTLLFLNEI